MSANNSRLQGLDRSKETLIIDSLDKRVKVAAEAVWQNAEAVTVVYEWLSLIVVMRGCQYCNVWSCLAGLRVSLLQNQRRVTAARVWV